MTEEQKARKHTKYLKNCLLRAEQMGEPYPIDFWREEYLRWHWVLESIIKKKFKNDK